MDTKQKPASTRREYKRIQRHPAFRELQQKGKDITEQRDEANRRIKKQDAILDAQNLALREITEVINAIEMIHGLDASKRQEAVTKYRASLIVLPAEEQKAA
jgi:hypothetical protein